MKSFRKFVPAVCIFAAALCVASKADAAAKLTFKNQTDRKVSVAVYMYLSDTWTKGWYNVDPGKSRTITLDTHGPGVANDTGYYAVAGKSVWKGNWRDGRIHPKKAFELHEDDEMDGAIEVGFRQLKLKKTGEYDAEGSVTLKFK